MFQPPDAPVVEDICMAFLGVTPRIFVCDPVTIGIMLNKGIAFEPTWRDWVGVYVEGHITEADSPVTWRWMFNAKDEDNSAISRFPARAYPYESAQHAAEYAVVPFTQYALMSLTFSRHFLPSPHPDKKYVLIYKRADGTTLSVSQAFRILNYHADPVEYAEVEFLPDGFVEVDVTADNAGPSHP